MGNVFRQGVLRTDQASVNGRSFAGFGESVVAGVEVFAFFEVLREVVGFGGEFAIEAEEALFVWGERADIDFVLLVGVHIEGIEDEDEVLLELQVWFAIYGIEKKTLFVVWRRNARGSLRIVSTKFIVQGQELRCWRRPVVKTNGLHHKNIPAVESSIAGYTVRCP